MAFGGDGNDNSGEAAETVRHSVHEVRRLSVESFGSPSEGWFSPAFSFQHMSECEMAAVDIDPLQTKEASKLERLLPVTLKFENVEYTIRCEIERSCLETLKSWKSRSQTSQQHVEKTILHGLSGVVRPGEFLGMLGPSGSGKTTLLNVLAGRLECKKGQQLSGRVVYNDQAFTNRMKRRIGFVTQDDVLFPHLTVKETLVYATYLRLPSALSKREKVERAETVIAELGLSKCKDTMIGDNLRVRGVSGGERKRVSIGHELLIDPSLLFLDEPTSGLDSTTSFKLIITLKNLAISGRTVVSTIHQPSSEIFDLFTKLLLLSEGHVLYNGPGWEAVSYFESLGLRPKSAATNPADFLLDLASGDTGTRKGKLIEPEAPTSKFLFGQDTKNVPVTPIDALSKAWLARAPDSIHRQTAADARKESKDVDLDSVTSVGSSKWPTTWLDQFLILIVRGLKERRHETFAFLRVFQVLAISVICGLLWWQTPITEIQDQVGMLFYLTTFWGFLPVFSAIFTFPLERRMIAKERASGMYRLSAYFFARTLGDLPMEMVLPFVSITLVYWMGGLKPAFVPYIATTLVVLLSVLVAQGLGLLLSAIFMDLKQATTLSSILLLSFQLAGGYFVQVTPPWIGWIRYVSFHYYAFKLQVIAQYSPTETYSCNTGFYRTCLVEDYPLIHRVGLNNPGTSLMALAIMFVAYRFLAYMALKKYVK